MNRNRNLVIVLSLLFFLSISSVTVFITSQFSHSHIAADIPCPACEKIQTCMHLLQSLMTPAAFIIAVIGLASCEPLLSRIASHTGVSDTLVSLKVKLTI